MGGVRAMAVQDVQQGSDKLVDDEELLSLMLADTRGKPSVCQPGPYWANKARTAAWNLRRFGLADFRGETNLAGLSFADNLHSDVRNTLSSSAGRLIHKLLMTRPLRSVFDAQVYWTRSYAHQNIALQQVLLQQSNAAKSLLKRYVVPFSLLGNCVQKVSLDGHSYAVHYLDILSQHDEIASRICFPRLRTVCEIGGGFGVTVHLLLANYPNIKKVLYLDIPPNLYVGTQYLRAFFGEAVSDYRALRNMPSIEFSTDENLQILCIAPWQLERFNDSVDILLNSHSFVEMPRNVVAYYSDQWCHRIAAKDAAIAMTTYDGFDPTTTIEPRDLTSFFPGRQFTAWEASTLINPSRVNYFAVSPGQFLATSHKDSHGTYPGCEAVWSPPGSQAL